MNDTLRAKYAINSFDVDPSAEARLTTLANLLQETAYRHATELELGYHHLAELDRAWVLSRMHIRMHAYPVWDEQVEVETWPRGIEKLFALRDFRITNPGGKLLAVASTCWLMVDTNSHRPVRIPADFIRIETRTDSVFGDMPGKIELPGELRHCEKRQVRYSDLDIVGHVNNVKYIEWCIDVLDTGSHDSSRITDIVINYISEAKPGDAVELQCSENNGDIRFISGINNTSGRECFRAAISNR